MGREHKTKGAPKIATGPWERKRENSVDTIDPLRIFGEKEFGTGNAGKVRAVELFLRYTTGRTL